MDRRPLRLADIAARCGGEVVGDPDVLIAQVATLRAARAGELAFLAQPRYRGELAATAASAVIVGEADRGATSIPRIVARDPYACFALASALLNPVPAVAAGIHPSATVAEGARVSPTAHLAAGCVVEAGAEIGDGAALGPGCVVGEQARIGAHCRLHARVTVYPHCVLGARAIVHSGAIVGADGFGFAPAGGRWLKIPQIGRVVVGEDVEIGANTTIDRGTIEDTVIEDGVKLDNLVQIAHNVRVGAHTVMAGTSAIAGSTKIGKRCMIAGGAAVINSIVVCDDVTLTVRAVVTKNIDKPGVYSGLFPAEEAAKWRRDVARFRRMDELAARVTAAEQRLAELASKKKDE